MFFTLIISLPVPSPCSSSLPLALLTAPPAVRSWVDDASSFQRHISWHLAQRHKHTIHPAACALLHDHDGGSSFVLGLALLAMWLPTAGSSVATLLHEVVVIATDSSRLSRCSSIVGSVVGGGDISPSLCYSNLPCSFPSSFLCKNLNKFWLWQPTHLAIVLRLQL